MGDGEVGVVGVVYDGVLVFGEGELMERPVVFGKGLDECW